MDRDSVVAVDPTDFTEAVGGAKFVNEIGLRIRQNVTQGLHHEIAPTFGAGSLCSMPTSALASIEPMVATTRAIFQRCLTAESSIVELVDAATEFHEVTSNRVGVCFQRLTRYSTA